MRPSNHPESVLNLNLCGRYSVPRQLSLWNLQMWLLE
jgi:hypothetical protein